MLPPDMLDLVKSDDAYRIVPFDVHRSDVLTANLACWLPPPLIPGSLAA